MLVEDLYKNCTFKVELHALTEEIQALGGVRQEDNLSPKLFATTLEDVFKTLKWEDRGIRIDGVKLSHLRYGDDIAVLINTLEELEEMLNELNDAWQRIGLKINIPKTNLEVPRPIELDNSPLEQVDKYVHVG
ncbi:hypothetical protein ILUMI_21006 [Ignelater luminosus]|uniref:Reverse transcriptase domain-containing protein n=1 Tax=Ignelater luminosus TaxID=2038154 RepID=A0A8K0CHB4_IGNLU|nr:hypothetical protein ILUMI_21006 [Ignelater luminosus]